MFRIESKARLRILIGVFACFVLGAGIFDLGYWQGRRALQPVTSGVASAEIHSGIVADPARLNPAHPPIPANATPEMKEFLENQATLSDKMEQLRSNAPGGALGAQAFTQFQQQNADLLKRQGQLAQIVAQQQDQNALTTPPQKTTPNDPPKLHAYLTARDQLMRDEIAFMNKHGTDNLRVRQLAMQKWQKDNATRFQQLQQLAQEVNPIGQP